jgi:hypothetical protein
MRAVLNQPAGGSTVGKVYEVTPYGIGYFHFIDDFGEKNSVASSKFDVLPNEPSTETAATTNVVDTAEGSKPRRPFVVGDKVRLRWMAYGTKLLNEYGSTESIREVYQVLNIDGGHEQLLNVSQLDRRMSDRWFDLVEPVKATTAKESNPKDIIGSTKASLCCVPCGPLFEVGAAMLDGSAKYGRHNWRAIGVRASVYYEAALRHLMRYWEGEDIDPDSGVHHLAHVSACCLIARDAAMCDMMEDDRPIRTGDPTSCVKTLIPVIKARYPDPKPPFTERGEK